MSTLLVDMEPGDGLELSGPATITIEEKTGRRTRLKVEADKAVQVKRLAGRKRA